MHYSTRFSATALDGRSFVAPTIGAAYASLSRYEGVRNSGQITPLSVRDGKDEVLFLTFDHLENFVVDLYRTSRSQFHLLTYQFAVTADGNCIVVNRETSCVSLEDLQEFIIANYATMKSPVFFQMNLKNHKWKYYGEFGSEKKFEIY